MKKISCIICVILVRIFALDASNSNLIFKNLNLQGLNNIESYAISEKFDGVRGIWDGKDMFSKSGKKLAIPPCFAEKLAILDLPKGAFVEGELWVDYGAFEDVSSIVRRKNASCTDFAKIKYWIFNANLGEFGDFMTHLATIKDILESHKITQIAVIPQHRLRNVDELMNFFNAVITKGGEGVIVRDSHTAFKLKPQNDAECKIIDFSRGKGRLSDKIGAIICESLADSNAGIKDGQIFRIGSGLSDEMRANPPKIGTIITYKFSGVSKNGIPKHTRFLRIYGE